MAQESKAIPDRSIPAIFKNLTVYASVSSHIFDLACNEKCMLKTHQGIGWLNLMQENYFMLTAYCYGLSILENRSGYFSLICLYLQ